MIQIKRSPDTSGRVKKADYSVIISEIGSEIPSISGLATNSELNAVENKIPDINNLIENTDYDAKISEVQNKCITAAY